MNLFTGSFCINCIVKWVYATSKEPNLRKIPSFQGTEKFYKLLTKTNMLAFDPKQLFIKVRKSWFSHLPFEHTISQTFCHMDLHFSFPPPPIMCHHPPWFSQDSAINDGVGARKCFHWHHRRDVFRLPEPLISPRPPASSPQRRLHS